MSSSFRESFTKFVRPQLLQPKLYDPTIIKRPMHIALLCRSFANAYSAVKELVKDIDPSALVTDRGHTMHNCMGPSVIVANVTREFFTKEMMIWYNGVSIHRFEKDELENMASRPIVFVYCFTEPCDKRFRDEKLEEKRIALLSLLNHRLYLNSPLPPYRAAYFKRRIAHVKDLLEQRGYANLSILLTDDDYDILADCSKFCAVDTMDQWITKLSQRIIVDGATAVDGPFIRSLLVDASDYREDGGISITHLDERAMETEMSMAAGEGPVLAKDQENVSKKRPRDE